VSLKVWHHIQPGNSTTWRRGNERRHRQDDELHLHGCIHAAPEQVWQGLTDPAFTKRYWRHQRAGVKTSRSDWTKGKTYDLAHGEVGLDVSYPNR